MSVDIFWSRLDKMENNMEQRFKTPLYEVSISNAVRIGEVNTTNLSAFDLSKVAFVRFPGFDGTRLPLKGLLRLGTVGRAVEGSSLGVSVEREFSADGVESFSIVFIVDIVQ
jgi:hypothetical protein